MSPESQIPSTGPLSVISNDDRTEVSDYLYYGGVRHLRRAYRIPLDLNCLHFNIENGRYRTKYLALKNANPEVNINPREERWAEEILKLLNGTFVDPNTNQVNIYAKLVLNPNCLLKFDWEWGNTGHFTIFTNDFLEELEFKVGYIYGPGQQEYQYGFDIKAQDVGIVRTIQWDGGGPRIWVLGDNPLPGDWDVWLLWNYNWYEVK